MTRPLPQGQLVPNETIDAWVLKQLQHGALTSGSLQSRMRGEAFGSLRIVDRALRRLKRAGKVELDLNRGRGPALWRIVK